MTELNYLTPGVRGFRDRSATLMAVGTLFVLGGLVFACMAGISPMGRLVRPGGQPRQSIGQFIASAMIYLGGAALLITLGVGAIRRRRWVRPIVLVLSTIALAMGTVGLVLWLAIAPDMPAAIRAADAPSPPPPGTATAPAPPAAPGTSVGAGMVAGVVVGMTIFIVTFYIAIPALLIRLFKDADMQATLELYDPQVRWTDAAPLAVLGLCALLAISGLGSLSMAPGGWVFAFGSLLTGAAGRGVAIALAAAFFAAAWMCYRLRPAGWWLALLLFLLLPIDWIVTLLRVDSSTIFRTIGVPPQHVGRTPILSALFRPALLAGAIGVMALGTIAYTIYLRRWFTKQ